MGSSKGLCWRPSMADELVFDILARLPVKSLMRSRCVCKDWRSLIDHNPTFAKSALNHSSTRFLVAIHDKKSQRQQIFTAEIDGEQPALHLLSHPYSNFCTDTHFSRNCFSNSVNGLVCIIGNNRLYVCNPALRQTHVLPTTSLDRGCALYSRIYMVYDAKTDSYKILHIRICDTISAFEILTLGTRSWRGLAGLSDYDVKVGQWRNDDALHNGAVHWRGFKKNENSNGVAVVAFHIAEERFEVIPLPTELTPQFHMGIRKGHLFAMDVIEDSETYEVWKMKDYPNKVWVSRLLTEKPCACLFGDPGASIKICGREDGQWTLTIDSDLEKKRLNKPILFGLLEERRRIIVAVAYVESIFWLGRNL